MARNQPDSSLSDRDLSDSEYGAIEQRVLDQVAPTPLRAARRRAVAVLAPIAGLAAVVALALSFRPKSEEFRAKGAALPSAAAIEVSCGVSGERVCRTGSSLLFTVDSGITSGYIGAYAQRLGDESRSKIWYFPDADGAAPRVEPGKGTLVLPEGIRIGSEHAPGRYKVTVWSSATPIARSQGDGSAPPARTSFIIEVVERE